MKCGVLCVPNSNNLKHLCVCCYFIHFVSSLMVTGLIASHVY